MKCTSSLPFRVLVNRQPTTAFVPSRDIRQGNPLSPFLFVICSEVFSIDKTLVLALYLLLTYFLLMTVYSFRRLLISLQLFYSLYSLSMRWSLARK